jgi:hypothetical protein
LPGDSFGQIDWNDFEAPRLVGASLPLIPEMRSDLFSPFAEVSAMTMKQRGLWRRIVGS